MRLRHFDIIKGMAIFLVVMGHVISMCVRGIDRAPLLKFIGEIHMPLFFFISGWLAARAKAPSILPKAKRLLLPMLAVSTLWIYYYPHSGLESPFTSTWSGLWTDTFKNGYWFTLVLFEIFAVYAALFPLFKKSGSPASQAALVLISWAALWLLKLLPDTAQGILSLDLLLEFYPVFMAGLIAARHADAFGRLIASPAAYTAAIIIAATTMYIACWYWEFPALEGVPMIFVRIALQLALAAIAIAAVKPWSEKVYAANPAGTKATRLWCLLGEKSLAIYLLHYFFLFPLGSARPLLEGFGLAFTPMLFFSAIIAAAIIAIVLLVDYILSFSPPLALFLTGREIKN